MDFPIVDTHLHVWDTGLLRYPWLADVPLLNKPYLLEDFGTACGGVDVAAMVFVQAEVDFAQFLEEAQWVASLAQEEDARIQGIVAWAPLEKGDLACRDLESLVQVPLMKGIRRIIQFEPDPEFCLRPEFIEGVQALPEFGLHFEVCIDHTQMANAIEMVAQCPQVTFIMDHIGKPNIKRRGLEPWQTDLKTMSQFPNMWCKMSGLVTEADHDNWTVADLQPYIDHVIECFGFDRVMYGGDWPVATQAAEYPRWVSALQQAVSGCSDSQLRKLFRENAIQFYRLG
jgi:L-fuconolactonase